MRVTKRSALESLPQVRITRDSYPFLKKWPLPAGMPVSRPTSKMSHGGTWRELCLSFGRSLGPTIGTARDKSRRWLWRLVRPIDRPPDEAEAKDGAPGIGSAKFHLCHEGCAGRTEKRTATSRDSLAKPAPAKTASDPRVQSRGDARRQSALTSMATPPRVFCLFRITGNPNCLTGAERA